MEAAKESKLEAGVDYPKVDNLAAVVEATPEKGPEEGGSDLLKAAQAKAPNLTAEFVKKHKLDDDYLARIARGEESPPPTVGPLGDNELHRTDSGAWVNVPGGVKPEDLGQHKIGSLR